MRISRIAPVVAGALALTLSGCSDAGGVVARVEGKPITNAQVDGVAQFVCDVSGASTQSPVPISEVRMQSLDALVQMQLIDLLAKKHHVDYDPKELSVRMQAAAAQLARLPRKDRAPGRALLTRSAIASIELEGIGRQDLQSKGTANPTDDQVGAAGQQLLTAYQKDADISIDPRFAPGAHGDAGGGVRSLSRAVSDFAKQSDATQPQPSWVMALPAQQRCGG